MSNTQKAAPKTASQARSRAMADPLVAAIVDADDIEHEDTPVPEWGGITLRVRAMDGATRNWYETQLFRIRAEANSDNMEIDSKGSRNAQLLSKCLFNPETDERLPITADQLAAKSGAVLARLASIALRLSGMDKRGQEQAEGNSRGRSGSSTSA